MTVKIWLYAIIIPLVTHLVSAININAIFKKNKVLEARIIYIIIIFIISYLLVSFFSEFIPNLN